MCRSMRHLWRHVACVALSLAPVAGCRFGILADASSGWPRATPALNEQDAPADRAAPPGQRPAPRTVPLEIVFIRADEHDATWQEDLWNLADEQALDGGLRRRIAANGLRAGLLNGHLPPELAARLEPAAPPADPGELPADEVERPAIVRRLLNLLPGRDNEVVAATKLDELIVFEHDGNEVHGGTYRDATTTFALKAWPTADGRVRVELVPTIKHGPLERSWVGEEGAFRLETGQRREPLDRLTVAATIPPGGTLLVGAAGDSSSSVGDAFFLDRAEGRHARRLLAIRMRGRPVDPLFRAHTSPTTSGVEATTDASDRAGP